LHGLTVNDILLAMQGGVELMENLLDVKEVARRLGGLSKYTVHSWLSSGKLRRTKIGSRTMVRESELERLIAEGDGGKSAGRPRPEQPQQ
jgi:excisionase family DNA binding protein